MITVYGIKNCDTVRKTLKWLDGHEVAYNFHDLRSDGITGKDVDRWLKQSPYEKLLNTRSTTWRQLSDSDKSDVDAKKAKALMVANPTLVKRPVIEAKKSLLVGFNEQELKKILL